MLNDIIIKALIKLYLLVGMNCQNDNEVGLHNRSIVNHFFLLALTRIVMSILYSY